MRPFHVPSCIPCIRCVPFFHFKIRQRFAEQSRESSVHRRRGVAASLSLFLPLLFSSSITLLLALSGWCRDSLVRTTLDSNEVANFSKPKPRGSRVHRRGRHILFIRDDSDVTATKIIRECRWHSSQLNFSPRQKCHLIFAVSPPCALHH